MLPAVAVEPLPEVALVVVETDADQRNAEVGRALDVVAGEDAEAARVNRNRLVQAELGGEVGDRPGPEHAGVTDAPGVLGLQVLLQATIGVVDAALKRQLRHPLLDPFRRQLLQERDRVVVALAPQHGIDLAEDAGGLAIPAPPEILRQRHEALARRRDELALCACLAHDRRELTARHGQHAHVLGVVGPRLQRLHHEDALQQPVIENRHPEERVVRIFTGFREVLEAWVCGGVGYDLRFEPLGHQSDEPFAQAHAHLADAARTQADGGCQHEADPVGFQQVDRAHVGLEPFLDEEDDVVQGFGRVAALRDQPPDFIEGPQQGVFFGRERVEAGRHRVSWIVAWPGSA